MICNKLSSSIQHSVQVVLILNAYVDRNDYVEENLISISYISHLIFDLMYTYNIAVDINGGC